MHERAVLAYAQTGSMRKALLIAGAAKSTATTKAGVVPNHAVQLRTTELCLKLAGYMKDDEDPLQMFKMVVQRIAPIFMKFIPPEKHAELSQEIEKNCS